MNIIKKDFALKQIAPYLQNPETCGYDSNSDSCVYLANNGNMCIAGKNLLPSVLKELTDNDISVFSIIEKYDGQDNTFISESANILTDFEWVELQKIHDKIAKKDFDAVKYVIKQLNLFTLKELEDFSNTKLS